MSQLKVNSIIPTAGVGTDTTTLKNGGGITQIRQVIKTDAFSTSSTSPVDVTGLTVDITPTASTSKILVIFSAWVSVAGDQHGVHVELHRDSSKIGDNYNQYPSVQSQTGGTVLNQVLDTPSTTSSVTYKVKIDTDSSDRTARIGAGSNGGTSNIPDSMITVMEVSA